MVLTMLKQEKVSKSEIFTGLAAGVEEIQSKPLEIAKKRRGQQ